MFDRESLFKMRDSNTEFLLNDRILIENSFRIEGFWYGIPSKTKDSNRDLSLKERIPIESSFCIQASQIENF